MDVLIMEDQIESEYYKYGVITSPATDQNLRPVQTDESRAFHICHHVTLQLLSGNISCGKLLSQLISFFYEKLFSELIERTICRIFEPKTKNTSFHTTPR